MPRLTRRRLLIALPLLAFLLGAGAVLLLGCGRGPKSRAAQIPVGMPREQVEGILGRPALVIRRSSGRGELLAWVNPMWQVDVLTGPDGRVESVGHKPSDSFYRRTVGEVIPLPTE